MRRLKKLGVCISMAVVGTTMMVSTVSAKSNDSEYYKDVRDSYTGPAYDIFWDYSDDQHDGLMEQCRIQNPENWYMDTGIIEAAREYMDKSKYSYVGNLRYMTEFQLAYIKCDANSAFNYGLFAIDASNPDHKIYVCKCSISDYERLKNNLGIDIDEFVYNDIDSYNQYNFDPDKEILKVDVYEIE